MMPHYCSPTKLPACLPACGAGQGHFPGLTAPPLPTPRSTRLPQPGGVEGAAVGEAIVQQPSSGSTSSSSSSVCNVVVLAGPRPAATPLAAPEGSVLLVEPTGCTGSFGYMVGWTSAQHC